MADLSDADRNAVRLPSGTVTFLFTDVEGSTRSWEERPVEMELALRLHDETVRRELDEHRGHVFSTAGDGFGAAFMAASEGVGAAVAIQRALINPSWPEHLRVRVRMGLHTGRASERDRNYFGSAVNRAARLMAAAHGGQIVCSQVTADLARVEVADDVIFESEGAVRLRDLLEPVPACRVCATGLPSAFPPLRSIDHARHNLPVQRTRLIGREQDVARVTELVRANRLVTLTGAGGSGKTRLALAAAAELADQFSDGVFLVELAPVADPGRVASVVAESLAVTVGSGERGPNAEALARFLSKRDLLIVLDNCEHLLDEVAELTEQLLSSGDRVHVLCTSREALTVDGEHQIRVSSLAVDASDGTGMCPALELLFDRATAMDDRFALDDEGLAAATEICRRLDGIPLAIELAAAQLNALSPPQLLHRLDRRFELLVGGPSRRRRRQQTLEEVMRWSWDLLNPEEQKLLACLSVFAGGWTLEAAEGICVGVVRAPVAAILRSLVAKSLIEPSSTAGGDRYRMLETVRLFGQQQLGDLGQAEDLRRRHCAWFLNWVEGPPLADRLFQFAWLDRLRRDFDNLSAAINWAIERERWPEASALVAAGTGLWLADVGANEAVRWTERLLSQDLDDALRARLLVAGAFAAVATGHHTRILPWATEAAALTQDGESLTHAVASTWGATPLMVRDAPEAHRLLAIARGAADADGSPAGRGFVESWVLHAELCNNDTRAATISMSDADRFGGADSWGWCAAVEVGVIANALDHRLDDALNLCAAFSPLSLKYVALRQGFEAMATGIAGNVAEARQLAVSFIPEANRSGDVFWHAELVLLLGIVNLRSGDPMTAFTYLEVAKRAPMFLPFWYALAVRFGVDARAQLSDDAIASAKQIARSSTVEAILDRELQARHSRRARRD